MEQLLTIIGTIASLASIPLSIYLYLKSKEAKFDRIKKEIVKILSYQIGEEREITTFEIQTVINSKLRENRFPINAINIDAIVEDLVAETISSPMIDRNRKKIILDNLRNIYVKGEILDKIDSLKFTDDKTLTWKNVEPKIKLLIESRNEIKSKFDNTKDKEKTYERISTWFAIISASISIIAAVIGYIGYDKIQKMINLFDQNKKIGLIGISLLEGLITSIIAGSIIVFFKKKVEK